MIRKVVPLALLAVAWWLTHRSSAPAKAEDVHVIALNGEPLRDAMDAGRCGEMLDELVSRPNWTLGVTTAGSDCFGWNNITTYEIHADGRVVYTEHGFTRTLELSRYEQAMIHDLGRLDCNEQLTEQGWSVWIAPGTPIFGRDTPIRRDTELAITLTDLLDRAVDRELDWRVRDLAPELHARAGKYRVSLEHGALVVRRHGRVVEKRTLWRHELVDLVDGIMRDPPRAPARGDATGTLTAGGVTYPVRFSPWERGSLDPLSQALRNAEYADEHPER